MKNAIKRTGLGFFHLNISWARLQSTRELCLKYNDIEEKDRADTKRMNLKINWFSTAKQKFFYFEL